METDLFKDKYLKIRIKALIYLAKHSENDIYARRLAMETFTTPSDLSKALQPLVKEDIVKERVEGNITYYELNKRNIFVADLAHTIAENLK